MPWHLRLLEAATAYLPVLLMALLALGTWWLVKSTPLPEAERPAAPPRHEPDYTMQQFMVQHFAPDGRLRVQVEGDELRHYPDTDTLEIANPRIRALAPDGAVTLASAQRALSNGDGSELQLFGSAQVVREASAGREAIEFRSEFLHAFLNTERVRSHLPVVVRRGASELRAVGMEYDNLARVIELKGRVRATFAARARPPGS
ncbi:MAG: LPS export ABC transporter periplasmic protein LptC [Piscinibacter sp.]|nr:LPS export ABC transporter periplasmic protein LptC [Piscinibacter sp.]